MRDVFRTPHAWATPLFGGMAARGGAGETGGSQEDSDTEGGPAFDLMDTNAKCKEIKRRTKEANLPACRPKSSRKAPSPRHFTDPGDAVPAHAARPAAAAAVEVVQDDDDEVEVLLSPPIAKRNQDNPRDRSKGSEEQHVCAAVEDAAKAGRARKKPWQPELGAVHEAAAEGGEEGGRLLQRRRREMKMKSMTRMTTASPKSPTPPTPGVRSAPRRSAVRPPTRTTVCRRHRHQHHHKRPGPGNAFVVRRVAYLMGRR